MIMSIIRREDLRAEEDSLTYLPSHRGGNEDKRRVARLPPITKTV